MSLGFLLPCTCRGRYGPHSSRSLQGVVSWGHSGMSSNVALAVCSTAGPSCTRVYLWGRLDRTPMLLQLQLPLESLPWSPPKTLSRVEMPLPTAHSPKSGYLVIHLPLKWRHQSVCVWALQIDKHWCWSLAKRVFWHSLMLMLEMLFQILNCSWKGFPIFETNLLFHSLQINQVTCRVQTATTCQV